MYPLTKRNAYPTMHLYDYGTFYLHLFSPIRSIRWLRRSNRHSGTLLDQESKYDWTGCDLNDAVNSGGWWPAVIKSEKLT